MDEKALSKIGPAPKVIKLFSIGFFLYHLNSDVDGMAKKKVKMTMGALLILYRLLHRKHRRITSPGCYIV